MNNRRIASVIAAASALSTFAGSAGAFSQESGYVADYEPVNVKGDAGRYDKLKHMSRAQRKRYKEKLRRKK